MEPSGLAERTIGLMASLAEGADDEERVYNIESRDLLLEAWASLASDCEKMCSTGDHSHPLSGKEEDFLLVLLAVFRSYVESECKAASAVFLEDSDDFVLPEYEDLSEEIARMDSAAYLARTTIQVGAVSQLAALLHQLAEDYSRQTDGISE